LSNIKNIKGIFFDLDGTLFDTAPELSDATNHMLSDLNLDKLDPLDIRNFIGRGADNLIKKSIALSSQLSSDPFFEEGKRLFHQHYMVNAGFSKPYDDAKDTLKKLKEKNIYLGCVTNKPKFFTQQILSQSGISGFMDIVISGDSLNKMKPDPLQIQHGCKALGLLPNQVIMVGDSSNDIEAGYAAGTYVITVPYGYNHGQSIDSPKVDLAIKILSDLTQVVN
jgi:phosphoglycolate phosphatase